MSLARYEPYNVINQLQGEINRLFDRDLWSDGTNRNVVAEWMPNVDIHEYNDRFALYADMPGVDPKDIELTLENGVLTITGRRELNVSEEGMEGTRLERPHGRFYRRFNLPDTVDSEAVKATDRHGVLEIVIPKKPQSQPRRITVKS